MRFERMFKAGWIIMAVGFLLTLVEAGTSVVGTITVTVGGFLHDNPKG